MSSFSQFAEWLARNPWFTIAAVLVNLLAFTLAIIFYIKGRKIKLPRYAVRSINIVKNLVSGIESLEILYCGQQIENLTVSRIAFWNAGSDTIDGEDISAIEPLTFHVKEGYKILDQKIIYQSRPANQFSVNRAKDRSYVLLDFDYIDKKQGTIIQLFHTGRSSEDIECRGSIKGAGKPIRKFVSVFEEVDSSARESVALTRSSAVMGFIMILVFVVIPMLLFLKSKPLSERIIACGIILIFVWLSLFLPFRRTAPKEFDIFEEEFFECSKDEFKNKSK
ncbi:MAG: hypothetical protein MUO78_04530 [candidate division Zixibacteria bacterium]|nr:hypothetical protein [candidate division Zixibacteria bacterium]